MSSSSDDGRAAAVGVRKFKFGALDSSSSSSSSDSDSDNLSAKNAARSKGRHLSSTARPGEAVAAGRTGGAGGKPRRGANSTSSLELSSSSSRSSSSSVSALPAAFRKAAAVSAAAQRQQTLSSTQVDRATTLATEAQEGRLSATSLSGAAVPTPTAEKQSSQVHTTLPSSARAGASTTRDGATASPRSMPGIAVSVDVSRYEEKQQLHLHSSGTSLLGIRDSLPRAATTTVARRMEEPVPAQLRSEGATAASMDTHTPSIGVAVKKLTLAVRPPAASSSSSSLSSTPRLAGPPPQVRGKTSTTSSSSESPLATAAPGLIAAASLPLSASSSLPLTKAVAQAPPPAALQVKKLALSSDSEDDAGMPLRPLPSSLLNPPPAASGLANDAVARVDSTSGVASSRTSTASLKAAVSRSEFTSPHAVLLSSRPVQGLSLPSAGTTATVVTLDAGSPTLSGPSSNLVYNRVSVRGIGSVPASLIEAPSRPKRRPLPCEHTASAATTMGPASLPATKVPSFDASKRNVLDDISSVEGGMNEESRSVGDGRRSAVAAHATPVAATVSTSPERSHRHAPQMPGRHSLPPPTLLEDGDAEMAPVQAKASATDEAEGPAADSLRTRKPTTSAPLTSSNTKHSCGRVLSSAPTDANRAASPPSQSSSPPHSYLARSAATAALQREREASLVIYDDRVPPAWRTGRHAQPFGKAVAPTLSRDPVAAWLALSEPVQKGRLQAATSLHKDGQSGNGDHFASRWSRCHPVLRAGDGYRKLIIAHRATSRSQQQGKLRRQAETEEEGEVEEMEEEAVHKYAGMESSAPYGRDQQRALLCPQNRHAQRIPSSAEYTSGSRTSKTHVSDAVMQQLLRQHEAQYSGKSAITGEEPHKEACPDAAPHVLSAGRVRHVSAHEMAAAQSKGAGAEPLSGTSKRRGASETGIVDILHYRGTRST